MLAEAAHSFADTLNQVFLMAALKRSKKPADAQHPFGYGMERYFWSLIAAVGIFVLGAGYSIFEGIKAVLEPEELGSLLDLLRRARRSASSSRAPRGSRRCASSAARPTSEGRGFFEHLQDHARPDREDGGLRGHRGADRDRAGRGRASPCTTSPARASGTALASIAIGLLLVVVAYSLGQQNKRALIGEALPRTPRTAIRQTIVESPGIDSLVELLTMRMSPEEVLVAARVDLDDTATVDELEQAAEEVERRVREQHPEVRHVFLDPTDDPDERLGTRSQGASVVSR